MTVREEPAHGRWSRLFAATATERWRKRALDLALAVPATLIIVGWLVIAIVHIDDRYEVSHGQGVWMALARIANVSGLYPELFDGTSYGGTRYMPVSILAHAGVARMTGEYTTSGKLVGLLATSALAIAVFGLLRKFGCRWSWALALTASIIGGYAGLRAGTTIGGEPLPVLFGVGALAAVTHSRRHATLLLAAVLVALGISAKFTALWAPAAIFIWLLSVDRRRAPAFAACVIAACVVLLGGFNLMSDGRMVQNLVATSGGGMQGAVGWLKAPGRLLSYLIEGEPAVWAFLPVLVGAVVTKGWRSQVAPLPVAWLVALALLIVIYVDVGTGPNQLIDLAVLTTLWVGALIAFADVGDARDRMLLTVLAAVLVWSNITAFNVRIRPPLQEAVRIVRSGFTPLSSRRDILAEYMPPGTSVLSADPGLLVERGETPVIVDPFMLRRLADKRPADVGRLVTRIERREFDLVVLVVELQDTNDRWWRDYHFGTNIITAVNRAYQFDRRVGPYYLYRPRS